MPQGPLGRVTAEPPAAPQAPTTAEGVPTVAPKAAAVPPTFTEPGLVGSSYKEEGGPGPEELHPVVKEQVALLRNDKLKALGKSLGLDPDAYNFQSRRAIRPGGSTHATERVQFIDDVMREMPPEEVQSIGRQASDLEHNAELRGMHKADRAETLFPRLRKATTTAANLDEYGNPTASGGSQGAVTVGEGLGNSGNSPPSLLGRVQVPDFKVELTPREVAEAKRLGQTPTEFDRLRRGMSPERYKTEVRGLRGENKTAGKPLPGEDRNTPINYPIEPKWNDPVAVRARARANAAEPMPTLRRTSGYGEGSELYGNLRRTEDDLIPTRSTSGFPGRGTGIPNPEQVMPKVTYQGAKGGATESMSDAARKETVGERTGKAGYGDFTKASLGAVAPLGAADQAVLKYGQTRPALGVIERVPGVPKSAKGYSEGLMSPPAEAHSGDLGVDYPQQQDLIPRRTWDTEAAKQRPQQPLTITKAQDPDFVSRMEEYNAKASREAARVGSPEFKTKRSALEKAIREKKNPQAAIDASIADGKLADKEAANTGDPKAMDRAVAILDRAVKRLR